MNSGQSALGAVPHLGCGLGYRRELADMIRGAAGRLDFVEIVAEQFMQSSEQLDQLIELRSVMPVIPHAIGLSIGSLGPIDRAYLHKLRQVSDASGAPYLSEHLCVTHVPGIEIGHLSPVPLNREVLARTVDNVRHVQDWMGKPLILENITYPFEIPGAEMSQAQFFSDLVEATGCGILLDLTNLHTNATNHGFDPVTFLESLPLDHVVQVHLAGGYWADDLLIDSHSEPVEEGSWLLLERLVEHIELRGSVIEQDSNFPDDPEALLAQVERARRIMGGRGDEPVGEAAE